MSARDVFQAIAGSWTSSSVQEPVLARSVQDVIAQSMADRLASFTLRDALQMPAVRRAVDLITTIGASFQPVAYDARGEQMDPQPVSVTKPDPFTSRRTFTNMTLRSLAENGNAYWREGEGFTQVVPWEDMEVDWEDSHTKLRRTYSWHGQDITNQVRHLMLAPRAGTLLGTSPLAECLDQLAIIDAQERYAQEWFDSGGVPHTILTTDFDLSPAEAKSLKDDYIAARQGGQGVAALPRGYGATFPQANPETAQLSESRDQGVAAVARLLGIPTPLLLVNMGSSTNVIYQNIQGVVTAFSRQTLLPMYLAPLEDALTDRIRGYVEYSVGELARVDLTQRMEIYQALVDLGVLSPQDVARAAGLPTAGISDDKQQKQDAPAPAQVAQENTV